MYKIIHNQFHYKMKPILIVLVLVFMSSLSQAKVILPSIFADNMVLQRNVLIPVWGWASANEKVEVSFNMQLKTTTANKDGKWMLKLEPETEGGPYELTIKGENTIRIKNVLVGEVWICSGQSNMEWAVGQSQNFKEELASANNPNIRHIKITKDINSAPLDNFKENVWQVCDSSTLGSFTAAGYFFAKNLYRELNVPIGLINSSWGGTNIETWISREAFENSDEFKEMIAAWPEVSIDSLAKLNVSSNLKRIEKLQGSKIGCKVDSFKEFSFDDSNWPEINQPELWEQQDLEGFDGVVWLRKTFLLSADEIKKDAFLYLSKIDDNDISYVNGVKIGSTSQWDTFRKYKISDGILKEGKNTIAVRVEDTGGGGGIYGNPEDLKLLLGSVNIPLNGPWKYQVEAVKSNLGVNDFPSLAYNAMINPLIPFAFKGVLWYQGESNAGRAFQYRKAFPLLIQDWRQKWNQGEFPFYFVQLATYTTKGNSNEGCDWAELREAQTLTLSVPNTGMVVTTDIGNPKDVHPTNKQDVGKRLAALALNNVYHKPMDCSGPMFKSMKTENNQIIVSFEDIGSGLFSPDKNVKGFEIAGEDQVFYQAKASIEGNTVILSSENVKNPLAIRFSWIGDASESNLFNKEGFPAIPFRTDDWKTITKEEKYKL